MAVNVPEYYLEQKFFEKVGYAKKLANGNMVGGCPFCREGKSWGKKARFNFYREKKCFSCFNCGEGFSAINFLKEIDGKTFKEVMTDLGSEIISGHNYEYSGHVVPVEEPNKVALPPDSINLSDPQQIEFYKGDYFVGQALKTIRERKLDVAPYRTDLFLSREDFIHKNRLIIPFYDSLGELTFYQSRSQTKKQNEIGKYLSVLDGRKTFYGLDRLDMSKGTAYILEGPLDCFFVANSIGGGGLKLNSAQDDVVDELRPFYNIVWILDNDFGNIDVRKRYLELIKAKENVFLWGEEYVGVKDINEYCVKKGILEVPHDQIDKRVFSGKQAVLELTKLV